MTRSHPSGAPASGLLREYRPGGGSSECACHGGSWRCASRPKQAVELHACRYNTGSRDWDRGNEDLASRTHSSPVQIDLNQLDGTARVLLDAFTSALSSAAISLCPIKSAKAGPRRSGTFSSCEGHGSRGLPHALYERSDEGEPRGNRRPHSLQTREYLVRSSAQAAGSQQGLITATKKSPNFRTIHALLQIG